MDEVPENRPKGKGKALPDTKRKELALLPSQNSGQNAGPTSFDQTPITASQQQSSGLR